MHQLQRPLDMQAWPAQPAINEGAQAVASSCCCYILHGMLMSCTAALLTAGYAAQSLLAAIGCVQFVSNVLFASWVLKEQVGGHTASCSWRCSPLPRQCLLVKYPV